MTNTNKIIATIIIVGGIITASIVSKTNIAITQENEREYQLDMCISEADFAYWSYVELNGNKNPDTGVINALVSVWERAETNKQQDLNNCFKRYQ